MIRLGSQPWRNLLSAGALAFGIGVLAAPARADAPGDLDAKARDAFARRDYAGAAEAFEEAYRVKPHPATKYNAALAWEKASELARAADAYEAALASEGLDPDRANGARTRLAVLKQQLGYLFVEKPIGGTVSVAHAKDVPIPARIHVAPGPVVVAVKRENGSTVNRELSVKAGTTVTVVVEGSGLTPTPTPTPTPTGPTQKPATAPVADRAPADGSCSSCTWGWVALGGAVLAAGAGTYFGLTTLSARDDFEDSGRTDADARDKAVSSRTMANVAFGVAAVAGGLGVYLLLTGKKDQPTAGQLDLHLGPGNVTSRVRF